MQGYFIFVLLPSYLLDFFHVSSYLLTVSLLDLKLNEGSFVVYH